MKKEEVAPRARREGILIQELSDEVLVYDLEDHKAHCLNKMAAMVWERCDGNMTARAIALSVGDELNTEVDERIVWHALDELGKAQLLEKRIEPPEGKARVSRRELMRRAGIAAMIAIPVVSSILAPKALASAASCGSPCSGGLFSPDCINAPGCPHCVLTRCT